MTDWLYSASLTVPSRVESIRPAAAFLVNTARQCRVSLAFDPLFEVAVVEALTNAMKHGNQGRPRAPILCELELLDAAFAIRIFDMGRGFSPDATRAPEIDSRDPESLPESGYGLPIIRAVFPDVRAVSRDGRFGIELRVDLRSA